MPNAFSFKIRGLEEIQAKLDRLPPEYSRRVLRSGLRAGGKVFRDELQHLAKRLTGWMASQVFMRVKTNNLDQGEVRVSFTKKPNPETGAPAINEALWKEFGFTHVGGKKIPAQPFIRPAFEAKKQAAVDAFADAARDALDVFK